jgi:hypothetical protein
VRKRFTLVELLILVTLGGITLSIIRPAACRSAPPPSASTSDAPAPAPADDDESASIAARLKPDTTEWRDGVAAVVLVDVSGSMDERVRNADGERERKIVIARRAALDLVRSFEMMR